MTMAVRSTTRMPASGPDRLPDSPITSSSESAVASPSGRRSPYLFQFIGPISARSAVAAASAGCYAAGDPSPFSRGVRAVDFSFTPDQQSVRDAVLKQCAQFTEDYWLQKDRE